MAEASSAEVQRNFGSYREIAEGKRTDPEPVTVMHYNKPSVVIVKASEYARLKRRDKQVKLIEDLPDWLADRIAAGEMEAQFSALDEPAYVPLPALTLGLVVRYEYLWARRAANDAETADADHPACVIATYRIDGAPEDFVVYLPISHSAPADGQVGIELTDHAKKAAGLDALPQWVVISECNIDTWPYDLRPIPTKPGCFHYGHLPPATFKSLRDQFIALFRSKRVKQVGRPHP